MDIIGIVGLIVGVAGCLLAFLIFKWHERSIKTYQDKVQSYKDQLQSLEDRNTSDAWHLYRVSLSTWQGAENLIRTTRELASSISGESASELSRLVGDIHRSSIEVTREIIKLIKSNEPIFTEEKLNQWRAETRIPTNFQLEQFKAIMRS